ncbi:hypothetical protein HD806DRAFT_552075 [Xylariaceae sp. AK1471]|nr:hypothetical protein HD806DRAFT_552075 [Xylariaceae sp. AK1471]
MPNSRPIIGPNYEGEDYSAKITQNGYNNFEMRPTTGKRNSNRERDRGPIKDLAKDLNIYNVNTQAVGNPHTQVGSEKDMASDRNLRGWFACIVGIVRIPYNDKFGTLDGPWISIEPDLVTMAEPALGILAVTIPTLKPLYYWFILQSKAPGSSIRHYAYCPRVERRHCSRSNSPYNSTEMPDTHPIRNDRVGPSHGQPAHTAKVETDSSAPTEADEGPGIHVTDQIELAIYANRDGEWIRVDDGNEPVQQ